MTSTFGEVLLSKNSPKLGIVQKVPCGTMGFLRPAVVVTDDIRNAKLAIELGKEWALLRLSFDRVRQFEYKLVRDVGYPIG